MKGRKGSLGAVGSGMPLYYSALHWRRPIDEHMWETLHSDTLLPPVTPHIRMHEPKCFVNKVETPFQRGKPFKCKKMVKTGKPMNRQPWGLGSLSSDKNLKGRHSHFGHTTHFRL